MDYQSDLVVSIANTFSAILRWRVGSNIANIGGLQTFFNRPMLVRLIDLNFRKKLSSKPAAVTSTDLPNHIASITDGFSFAYLKEAYLSALLLLIQDSAKKEVQPLEENESDNDDEEDRKWGRFGNLLQQQVATLRQDIVVE